MGPSTLPCETPLRFISLSENERSHIMNIWLTLYTKRQPFINVLCQIQARRFLCRHYYPEGGWGWVVAVCAVLVHVLNHGVQLSCSQLVEPAAFKFHVAAVYPAGIYLLFRCATAARYKITGKVAGNGTGMPQGSDRGPVVSRDVKLLQTSLRNNSCIGNENGVPQCSGCEPFLFLDILNGLYWPGFVWVNNITIMTETLYFL